MRLPMQITLLSSSSASFTSCSPFKEAEIAGGPHLPFPHRYIYLHIFIVPLFTFFSNVNPMIFCRISADLSLNPF